MTDSKWKLASAYDGGDTQRVLADSAGSVRIPSFIPVYFRDGWPVAIVFFYDARPGRQGPNTKSDPVTPDLRGEWMNRREFAEVTIRTGKDGSFVVTSRPYFLRKEDPEPTTDRIDALRQWGEVINGWFLPPVAPAPVVQAPKGPSKTLKGISRIQLERIMVALERGGPITRRRNWDPVAYAGVILFSLQGRGYALYVQPSGQAFLHDGHPEHPGHPMYYLQNPVLHRFDTDFKRGWMEAVAAVVRGHLGV